MKLSIIVVSESGIYLGCTYPKRAKGLVKKGVAFWDPKEEGKVLVLKRKWNKEDQNERSAEI